MITKSSKKLLFLCSLITFTVGTSYTLANTKMTPIINYVLLADEPNAQAEYKYSKNTGPDKNPLKGWNSGWYNRDRDEASVGFQYIPWRVFEPDNDDFSGTKDAIENIINRDGSKGRHLILRIYCDWAGTHDITRPNKEWLGRSDGCPEWMYDEVGVDHITGIDRGVKRYDKATPLLPTVTDFNDSKYLGQAEQIIAKFAELYNDDPRIFTIQMGILGYWGEWHTFGSNLDENSGYVIDKYNKSYTISDDAKRTVIDAYQNAFTQSKIVGRYPSDSILSGEDNIGFHNDFFMPFRGNSASFDQEIEDNMFWKNGPVGGEAPPEFNRQNNADTDVNRKAVFTTERGLEMIETGHYTTMLLEKPTDPDELSGYMYLHRKMGYNYQIEKAVFAPNLPEKSELNLSLFINNIGVAPIYYSWDVEFALLDNDNNALALNEADNYDLQSIMPTDISQIDGRIDTSHLSRGQYRLGVRVIQPNSQINKDERWKLLARNTYIEFSNDIETIEGYWNEDNALQGGWSILGSVRID